MRLHVADHPLIDHKLSVLRDERTPSAVFRQLVDELVTLLAYEATREVRTEEGEIRTPVAYANRLPDDLSGRQCFVVDPMLATGHTLVAAIDYLLERGARDVTALCLIAAPEGIKTLEEAVGERANVTVVTAGVDERLNEHAYIVPGLGDAGDRLYGIVD